MREKLIIVFVSGENSDSKSFMNQNRAERNRFSPL